MNTLFIFAMRLFRNSYIVIALLILFSFSFSLNAKESKPFKTGLVLSGGGAKGLAHIGLLQLIDSLGIQVDYLTGTSMGAIVGALYASGYSGDSINSIVEQIDWNYILSNKIPLQEVHIIEKESYGKSIAALPLKKGIPMLPNALIEGQFITDEMNRLLFHTRNINDFSKLPIPLKVIASDILTGEAVKLDAGSIPLSIRASMAIPAVFTPVHLNGYLLVDGGMTRNFPVESVREMGSDIVIGSYTGMRIRSKEEINNPLSMISQVFAFEAVSDADKQKDLTDIVLDFSDPLANFQPQSFFDYKKIIKIGREEAYRILPELIALKKKQEAAGIKRQRNILSKHNIPIKKINTYTQESKPLSKDENAVFQAILTEEGFGKLDDYDFLQKKISEIYSLGFYSKIDYTFSHYGDSSKNLNIFVKPVERELKVSLHFDTYESAGIIFRFNQNNFWLSNSKISLGIDLSAYPKTDISYLKFLNDRLNFWGQIRYNSQVQPYNDLYFKLISQAIFHTKSNLKKTNQTVSVSFGYAPTTNSSFTLNGAYQYDKIKKENGVLSKLPIIEDATSSNLPMYIHSQASLKVKYSLNTLNASHYPTSGLKFNTNIGWLHNLAYSFHLPPQSDELGRIFYETLNPKTDNRKIYNDVFQTNIDVHYALPLNEKLSLQTYLFAGMNFAKKNNKLSFINDEDYLFVSQMYTIGGYNNYDYSHQIPFAGFDINEVYNNGFFSLTSSLQWNIWKKIYLTPRISIGQVLNHYNPFSKENSDEWFLGFGADVDYLSPLGPIKIGFGINNQFGIAIGLLSLGYQF